MILEIKNDIIELKVDTLGGQIMSLVKDKVEYMWQRDPAIWRQSAPNLFPFIGRSFNGTYSHKGKAYEMTPHGFLSRMEFTVLENKGDELVLEFTSNKDTLAIYPFEFKYALSFKLDRNRVIQSHRVINLGNETMYFGMGGHPGFNVPLDEGLDFSDYYLEFSDICYPMELELTKNLQMSGNAHDYKILNNKIIPLDHHLFDFDSITLKNMAREVTLRSDKGKRSVKLTYPGMGFLGIWHKPRCEAPYICIEPWVSLPGRELCEEIGAKSDFIALEGNREYINTWSIEVE